jgi:flagellar basal body-associated protein FliL
VYVCVVLPQHLAIIGIVVGIVLLLIALGIVLFLILFIKRRKQKHQQQNQHQQYDQHISTTQHQSETVVIESVSKTVHDETNTTATLSTYQPGICL